MANRLYALAAFGQLVYIQVMLITRDWRKYSGHAGLTEDLELTLARDPMPEQGPGVLDAPDALAQRLLNLAFLHEIHLGNDPGRVDGAFELGNLSVTALVVPVLQGYELSADAPLQISTASISAQLRVTPSRVMVAGSRSDTPVLGMAFQAADSASGRYIAAETSRWHQTAASHRGSVSMETLPQPLPTYQELGQGEFTPEGVAPHARPLWDMAYHLGRVSFDIDHALTPHPRNPVPASMYHVLQVEVGTTRL